MLKKDDTVCYLLANAEWERGIENQRRTTDFTFSLSLYKIQKVVIIKNELALYYLEDEFILKR
ncbi:16008_t:CDS:1, partial [Funneliformis caledonium]